MRNYVLIIEDFSYLMNFFFLCIHLIDESNEKISHTILNYLTTCCIKNKLLIPKYQNNIENHGLKKNIYLLVRMRLELPI